MLDLPTLPLADREARTERTQAPFFVQRRTVQPGAAALSISGYKQQCLTLMHGMISLVVLPGGAARFSLCAP